MPVGTEVRIGQTTLCQMGTKLPSSKRGRSPLPNFRPVYCGQTAGWIKMALRMEVGLGPGHMVLDGDPAPIPKKGTQPPIFGSFLLWPNGWMHQDATWYRGRPQPRRRLLWPNGCMDQDATWYGDRPRPTRHCVRWGPSYLQKKAHPLPILGHVYGHGRLFRLLLSYSYSCLSYLGYRVREVRDVTSGR